MVYSGEYLDGVRHFLFLEVWKGVCSMLSKHLNDIDVKNSDGDGEQIFEELSNSTVTLVDVPDW